MDLSLNNLQRLICHKTQPTNQPTILSLTHTQKLLSPLLLLLFVFVPLSITFKPLLSIFHHGFVKYFLPYLFHCFNFKTLSIYFSLFRSLSSLQLSPSLSLPIYIYIYIFFFSLNTLFFFFAYSFFLYFVFFSMSYFIFNPHFSVL